MQTFRTVGEWIVLLPLWRRWIKSRVSQISMAVITGSVWVIIAVLLMASAGSDEPADGPGSTTAVTYTVAQREDVSFGATIRIVYRVDVSGPLIESDLRAISDQIIEIETDQQDVNAIGFFYYLPGTDTSGVYTAGSADWAPGGDWSKADTVSAGDYSQHELGAINLAP